ncbi:transcription initiation factor TFIID subunit 7-like protein [Carex littledalei]|uniref:Transcription initiation factor TFIID subunit 7-like protein n=1 Tax=Carex littledalei TaxID=544730 RepID=A0A833RR27_9POAL|nr:transcription initiation factor TFIID subunit 7-like protein [Carex littledalei]
MEEQFILRVPPSVAERIERLLSENTTSSSEDASLDLSFSEDGRNGTFNIGNESFPASLLDLPCIVESYKTYDESLLIKTADVGQMIMVREEGDPVPEGVESRHGLTPPMRNARTKRFRREPDLNPELVQRVEKDLMCIMSGGTVAYTNAGTGEGDEGGGSHKKAVPASSTDKQDARTVETAATGEEPDQSESDDSMEQDN